MRGVVYMFRFASFRVMNMISASWPFFFHPQVSTRGTYRFIKFTLRMKLKGQVETNVVEIIQMSTKMISRL